MSRRLLSSNKYPYYSRKRFGSFRGEDRISHLPNDVLCRILSFLPSTKCVVRTSILSKTWKKIWTSVPNLYFRDEDFFSSDDFIAFVDRVLLLRGSSAIQKFHLQFDSCPPEDLCRVDYWISAAARCNVVELVLAVSSSDGRQIFKLPASLATCRTVEVLRLMSLFMIENLPPRASFTRLKCLHIHFTAVIYGEYISIAGLDFSVLEHFIIDGDPERHLMDVDISAPRLKTLTIEFSSSHGNHKYYNIDIDAQNLEKLEIKEGNLSNFTLENTESLVEADIEIYVHPSEEDHVQVGSVRRATEFLAALYAVKYLSLSWCFYEGCSVPAFNNLIQLKLVHFGCSHWWKNLMKLLERSPNLQCLFIDNGNYPIRKQLEVEENDEEEDEVIEHIGNEAPVSDITKLTNVQNWCPPNTVPNCLLSQLKTIAIRGFVGKGCIGYLDEMEVTKYLLKNGRVLEKMIIYTPGLFRETKKDIWKETGMILWGSKFVCVEVIQKMIDAY